jgi:hypothetical protein
MAGRPARASRLVSLLLGAALAACVAPGGEQGSGMMATDQNATLPPGAIAAGERLYMVPVGVDTDGCEQFTPFSSGGMTNQAIHYRLPDGSFVLAKDPAACRVEMVPLPPSVDGCARFQARPAAGLTPTAVAYRPALAGGYVVIREEAACAS